MWKITLFEFACSDDSIGKVSAIYGFKCIRLSRSTIDLCDASQLEQALGQVEQSPPADNGFASFAHITHHCST